MHHCTNCVCKARADGCLSGLNIKLDLLERKRLHKDLGYAANSTLAGGCLTSYANDHACQEKYETLNMLNTNFP